MKHAALRDVEERNQLVMRWYYLPRFVCKRMTATLRRYKVRLEDAEQEGFIAMVRAAELWQEDQGASFSTYAYRSVHNHISKFCKTSGLVSLPAKSCHLHQKQRERAEVIARLTVQNSSTLTVSEYDPSILEDLSQVREAIEALEHPYGDLLRMRFMEGMAISQAANALGMDNSQLRKLQRQALYRLRKVIRR